MARVDCAREKTEIIKRRKKHFWTDSQPPPVSGRNPRHEANRRRCRKKPILRFVKRDMCAKKEKNRIKEKGVQNVGMKNKKGRDGLREREIASRVGVAALSSARLLPPHSRRKIFRVFFVGSYDFFFLRKRFFSFPPPSRRVRQVATQCDR